MDMIFCFLLFAGGVIGYMVLQTCIDYKMDAKINKLKIDLNICENRLDAAEARLQTLLERLGGDGE